VWFLSPEFDLDFISSVSQQMQPALQLFYIHNGHMPDEDFNKLKALSPDLPLVGMAPHVASYVTGRLQQGQQQQQQGQQQEQGHAQQQQQQQQTTGDTAEWLLPTWPFEPQQPCSQVREVNTGLIGVHTWQRGSPIHWLSLGFSQVEQLQCITNLVNCMLSDQPTYANAARVTIQLDWVAYRFAGTTRLCEQQNVQAPACCSVQRWVIHPATMAMVAAVQCVNKGSCVARHADQRCLSTCSQCAG
jgi:hypothetical protein